MREAEEERDPSHNALHQPDLRRSDFVAPSGASAIDRHTGKLALFLLEGLLSAALLRRLMLICLERLNGFRIGVNFFFLANKTILSYSADRKMINWRQNWLCNA